MNYKNIYGLFFYLENEYDYYAESTLDSIFVKLIGDDLSEMIDSLVEELAERPPSRITDGSIMDSNVMTILRNGMDMDYSSEAVYIRQAIKDSLKEKRKLIQEERERKLLERDKQAKERAREFRLKQYEELKKEFECERI